MNLEKKFNLETFELFREIINKPRIKVLYFIFTINDINII